jgi:hypothetical protein
MQRFAIEMRLDRSGGGVKGAHNRETLQTTGCTTRILNRPKRVCADPSHPRRVTNSDGPSECVFLGMTESIGPMWSKPKPTPGRSR